ncbi:hypothetical protein PoB_007078200 [Plakobranchus ocellatus]|uniref:Uncharacterized protein n=1 Tax=Plakobranchus ocellatus TaxID=259542 RepID=A0AAV4DJ34_9GAST|nr:hypothetical protein PoB_007078200 [Plakobranchus ocellatus]
MATLHTHHTLPTVALYSDLFQHRREVPEYGSNTRDMQSDLGNTSSIMALGQDNGENRPLSKAFQEAKNGSLGPAPYLSDSHIAGCGAHEVEAAVMSRFLSRLLVAADARKSAPQFGQDLRVVRQPWDVCLPTP